MNYGGWEIHVVPRDDTASHIATLDCWCGPEINEDGTIVHDPEDGRKVYETGERKVS